MQVVNRINVDDVRSPWTGLAPQTRAYTIVGLYQKSLVKTDLKPADEL